MPELKRPCFDEVSCSLMVSDSREQFMTCWGVTPQERNAKGKYPIAHRRKWQRLPVGAVVENP